MGLDDLRERMGSGEGRRAGKYGTSALLQAVIGLAILSGSHGGRVVEVLEGLRQAGLAELPVVVGGIIPEDDAASLRAAGVRRVYTPKDFDLTRIMGEIVDVVAESAAVH